MKELTLILGLAAMVFSGCNEQVDPEAIEHKTMMVNINHTFDDEELIFLSEDYTLESGDIVNFKRLSYLLSKFYLVKADDTRVELVDQYAFLSPASDVRNFELIDIPMGEYKAFGFSVGLDSAVDHGDPNQYPTSHPLSPIRNSLHWDWTAGYIFTAIEGQIAEKSENFVFHLAGNNNILDFEFPINITKEKASLEATLTYNVAEIFRTPETYSLVADGMSTHTVENPITTKLINNMHDIFSFNTITSSGQ